MATAGRDHVKDIRALARRVHLRWLEYRRRYPGMSVPISDTLSRILEHEPEYQPLRPRSPFRRRPALQNPGVFTMKEVADALQTTVGDLLDEPGYRSIRDVVSRADRRKLRDVVSLLRALFDLDDETLDGPAIAAADDEPFLVPEADFIAQDYDYPRTLHAWVIPEGVAVNETAAIREVHDPRFRVIRILGASMEPELSEGAKLIVDLERTTPEPDALVAVYLHDRGGVLGRWDAAGESVTLRRANPAFAPIVLEKDDAWTVWGTATTIVEAPRRAS